MPATILAPRTNDSVATPVPVSSAYTFTSATTLADHVGGDQNGGTSVNGSGTNNGSVTTALTGLQTVAVTGNGIQQDSQPNVNVIAAGGVPPVFIDSAMFTVTKKATSRRTFTVRGKCDPNVTPLQAFVMCNAYAVNLGTGELTPVAVGIDLPRGAAKNWTVTLQFDVAANVHYVARAFLFNFDFNRIASFTKVLV